MVWLATKMGASPESSDETAAGHWPSSWRVFVWDLLLPSAVAPARDGGKAPARSPDAAEWVDAVPRARLDEALETYRALRVDAEVAVPAVELKASRLLQPVVTSVIAAGAVAGFGFRQVGVSGGWLRFVAMASAAFGSFAVGSLFAGAVVALGADIRVGFYAPRPEDEFTEQDDEPRREQERFKRGQLRREVYAIQYADWSRKRKLGDLMKARALCVRGFVALLLAGVLAGMTLVSASEPQPQPVVVVTPATTPQVTPLPSSAPGRPAPTPSRSHTRGPHPGSATPLPRTFAPTSSP